MISLQKIVIPGIVIGLVGGTIMFILAFSYYPEKHVNINLNGNCYEFLGNAYGDYKILELEKENEIKKLQIQAIGNPKNIVPITFSGSDKVTSEFINTNNINITYKKSLDNSSKIIDKTIFKGTIINEDLKKLVDESYSNNTESFSKTILLSLGIQSNPYITSEESLQISKNINQFIQNGIKKIIDNNDGVKKAECRSKIVYEDI
ncbi:MAG: hypothetical protein H0U27_03545 [Nitrosopumilus sp.]|nr:hypothetical protein [Nitrosopumilus sp.]